MDKKIEAALDTLKLYIDHGVEYPDAFCKTVMAYMLNEKQAIKLAQAYDAN